MRETFDDSVVLIKNQMQTMFGLNLEIHRSYLEGQDDEIRWDIVFGERHPLFTMRVINQRVDVFDENYKLALRCPFGPWITDWAVEDIVGTSYYSFYYFEQFQRVQEGIEYRIAELFSETRRQADDLIYNIQWIYQPFALECGKPYYVADLHWTKSGLATTSIQIHIYEHEIQTRLHENFNGIDLWVFRAITPENVDNVFEIVNRITH
jgi:hypothetical protein